MAPGGALASCLHHNFCEAAAAAAAPVACFPSGAHGHAGADFWGLAPRPLRRRPSRAASAFIKEPEVFQSISCTTTANEVAFRGGLARVYCPAHCERAPKALAIGSGVHPMRSSVCVSAQVDNVIPQFGGELLLTLGRGHEGPQTYTGAENGYVASVGSVGEHGNTWSAYSIDNLDMMGAPWPKKEELQCETPFRQLPLEHVGDSVVVECPGKCSGKGALNGTHIHPPGTSVCRAAQFDLVLPDSGGQAVVTRRNGQDFFFGKRGARDASNDFGGATDAYTVASPVTSVIDRVTLAGFL